MFVKKFCILFAFILIAGLSASATFADEPLMSSSNIALHKPVLGNLMKGDLSVITDGRFALEGSRWDVPETSPSQSDPHAFVIIDLGAISPVKAIILQADWNDSYIVEASIDGQLWNKMTYLPKKGYEEGLQTRSHIFPSAINASQIRIREGNGDNVISISEFQAYSEVPNNWSELIEPPSLHNSYAWLPSLNVNRIDRIKEIILSLGLLLAFWSLVADKVRPRLRRVCFAILALLSFLLWGNAAQFHYQSLIHRHEFFHYYLGAKYNHELSYTRLYECATLADREDGLLSQGQDRIIRNLSSNVMESASPVLSNPSLCKGHFSESQWMNFKRDVAWFRQSMTSEEYDKIFGDHGFNATPVWSVLGSLFSKVTEASTTQLFGLGLLDLLLLSVTWVVVFRTFGIEQTAVAMLFWGCNFVARFAWTGNGFLRSDWFVLSLLGLCALKKNRLFTAGFFLAYAGLVRIFPFALLGGIFLKFVVMTIRDRSLGYAKIHHEVLQGALTAFVSLSILATINGGGLNVWKDFYENTIKHYNTASTNMMGLRPLFSLSGDSLSDDIRDPLMPDVFTDWFKCKSDLFGQRKLYYGFCSAIGLAMLLYCALNLSMFYMAILGMSVASLIPLSNYDYYFLTFYAFLAPLGAVIPIGLLCTGLWSWHIPRMFGEEEKGYSVLTFEILIFIWCTIISLTYRGYKSARKVTNESF